MNFTHFLERQQVQAVVGQSTQEVSLRVFRLLLGLLGGSI